MRIPPEKIEEIRQANDIVEVVSGYVNLRPRGKNYFGLCPFHQEKTPSFAVNPQMQIFRCFGCGAGGNVFHFIMRMEGLSFLDAVKLLAQRAGIALELDRGESAESKAKKLLYEIHSIASEFFREKLHSAEGKKAFDYLRSRGLTKETIDTFGLGYAPDSWDALLLFGQKKGFSVEVLEKSGLVIRREGGGFYDRFRNRVVFPLFDLMGRVVGFGARRLEEDESTPKYINSPETEIYKKGATLYGLYQAREAVRQQDRAVVVEGYMDLISLYQHGIRNVVATLGTALTPDQARLILRYTTNAVLFYDSDSPGFAAAMRGAEILMSEGIDVKVATVPAGEDPDSFVRSRGTEAVEALLERAESLFHFRLRRELERVDATDPGARAAVASRVLESIAKIKNELKRSVWVSWLADELRLDERALNLELQRQLRGRVRLEVSARRGAPPKTPKVRSRREQAERTLIGVLFCNESMREYVLEGLAHLKLRDPDAQAIWEVLQNLDVHREIDPTKVLSYLEEPTAAEFLTELVEGSPERFASKRLAVDCFRTIRGDEIDRAVGQLQALQRSEPERSADFARRIVELMRLKAKIERGELDPRFVDVADLSFEGEEEPAQHGREG